MLEEALDGLGFLPFALPIYESVKHKTAKKDERNKSSYNETPRSQRIGG